jgi:phosphoadenosine phosphosulfate reductase
MYKEQVKKIEEKINTYHQQGKKLFATSSFQSHSIPMLHIISQIDNSIPVYFTNTGFLFPQTLQFKNQLAELFNLTIIGLEPPTPKVFQTDENGLFLFASDPDYCCYLNKIQPLEPVLAEYDVWINGIRADQSETRKNMKEEQEAPFNTLRYHPMLHWTSKMIYQYIHDYKLPAHPLEKEGYISIGCEPCTTKFFDEGNERNARWFGMNKTECGLHTELVNKK